jgi:hypothetical protein
MLVKEGSQAARLLYRASDRNRAAQFAKPENYVAVRDERGAKIFKAPITSTVRYV